MPLDLLWQSTDGRALALIDAKDKAEKLAGFPNADQYQLLAYCTALRLSEGHLVYAKGSEMARSHEVRHVGIRIHTHTLDLAQRPDDLLASVAHLADQITVGAVRQAGAHG